jgi:hypothetical protein
LLGQLLPGLLADVLDQSSAELSLDVRRLNSELAELRASLGELRTPLRTDRAERSGNHAIDLPRWPKQPVN